jgi:hypothetical protein
MTPVIHFFLTMSKSCTTRRPTSAENWKKFIVSVSNFIKEA